MAVSSSKPVFWPLVALLCSACSFIGLKRAPSDLEPGEAPECTASYTLPLLDFAGAVTSGSAAVVMHGQASSEQDEPDGGSSKSFRVVAWTATGLAAAFIVSGAYGSRVVKRCRGLQAGAGILPAEGPNPNVLEESKPGRGTPGASCKKDVDCGDDLVCDEPMKTCVEPPAPPPTEPPPQPDAPPDAGPSQSP